MEFAEKLQSYRKQRGMSQENLAEVVGVSRQAVSKWESGQSYPEMDTSGQGCAGQLRWRWDRARGQTHDRAYTGPICYGFEVSVSL
ncbi:helix-turn-helix transcriptional regulator [Paenibacillus stellifer]|uniref:helix-turn-helix transcriptional regulator n=1 Tax=Paenibacillus stellifer TaxID=169760 RepID=UPI000A04A437|nr:helix-turn-helix transcriptional regulator [Paenibacillus stellifer]